eukprot:687599-Amphidinium_carterae.1
MSQVQVALKEQNLVVVDPLDKLRGDNSINTRRADFHWKPPPNLSKYPKSQKSIPRSLKEPTT